MPANMTRAAADVIALITLMLWPAVPLFWVPVHCMPRFFKRLGFLTYVLPCVTWLPVACLVFLHRTFLFGARFPLPPAVNIGGALILVAGVALQIWTLLLLKFPVIMGMPEVTAKVRGELVTGGPFSVIRHPTYVSHTLMLLGVFLMTGVAATGAVALVDLLIVNVIIIPLEERELAERFGDEYERYRQRVPSRFFPRKFHR